MRPSTAGGAAKRGSGRNQFKHQPLIRPEWPEPASVTTARAASAEILVWLALLLIVVGAAKGMK